VTDDATPPPGEDVPARAAFWRRLVAFVIDAIVIGLVAVVVFVSMGGDLPESGEVLSPRDRSGLALSGLVVGFVYMGVLNGSPRGQTPGKILLRIRVRDATSDAPIGLARGLLRAGVVNGLMAFLGAVPVIVDGMWALFDAQRQTFHDKAARSVVVDVFADGAVPDGAVPDGADPES
jgi:uncharacterized RDD family membrane protein YckC